MRFVNSDELLVTGKLLGLPRNKCAYRTGQRNAPDACRMDSGRVCIEETYLGQCTVHIEEELEEITRRLKVSRPIKNQFVVPSESSDKEYVVTQYADGPFDNLRSYPIAALNRDGQAQWACSCIGWIRHSPRRECKHISYAKAGGAKTFVEATANILLGKKL